MCLFLDSSTPPTRIRHHFETEEEGSACIWRIAVCKLRQGPGRARFFDRGAEDCEEGAQGITTEEALNRISMEGELRLDRVS